MQRHHACRGTVYAEAPQRHHACRGNVHACRGTMHAGEHPPHHIGPCNVLSMPSAQALPPRHLKRAMAEQARQLELQFTEKMGAKRKESSEVMGCMGHGRIARGLPGGRIVSCAYLGAGSQGLIKVNERVAKLEEAQAGLPALQVGPPHAPWLSDLGVHPCHAPHIPPCA